MEGVICSGKPRWEKPKEREEGNLCGLKNQVQKIKEYIQLILAVPIVNVIENYLTQPRADLALVPLVPWHQLELTRKNIKKC